MNAIVCYLHQTGVTAVTLGKYVKTVGTSAFEGCSKLTKVYMAKNVTKIGANAFKNCKKLGSYRKLFKGKGQSKKVKFIKI